ncbi:diguanylate cyclase [Dechloromonas sp. CZR5]|uniref:GGDEF domain-containing response regulator n=1 Tax=Dechloromonas sp. CZR5 TaxID=2608630 RepID=UPI00123C9D7C|nr:diguanylate cyclase [Dechloromonas sp. CZR5]
MNPLRILLVDDSLSVGEYISSLLRSNGHTVTHVRSGEKAVAAFQESPPELILMDIEMPGMGGLEAIRQIRKVLLPVRIPIIVVTSHADQTSLLDSFMAGADDYLTKPLDPLQLDVRIQAMMRIVSAQRSTAAMIDSAMEGIVRIDRVGRITAFNKAAEGIFGYTLNEVLGQNVKMLMPSPERDKHDEYMGNYAATGEHKIIGTSREVVGLRKNGETFPMHLGVTEAETPDDRFFIGMVRDLTVEKALRSKLAESRNFLADVIENSPAATYVKNREGRYLLVNRMYEEVTGLSRAQTLGKTDADIFPATMAESYRQVDKEVMATGRTIEAEEALVDARGETCFLSIKFPTRNTAGEITGICGISTDITQIKHYQKELERLSRFDELTNLYNRRHFMTLARHELNRGKRYGGKISVMMIDIDHFKRVNDNHGHRTGDIVLAAIASQISQALRDTDIAGRLGGEEFSVVLPETELGNAILVAERLRQQVAAGAIDIGSGNTLNCTLSIGVADWTDKTEDVEKLLHRADQALYEAKNSGRNKVVSAGFDRPE